MNPVESPSPLLLLGGLHHQAVPRAPFVLLGHPLLWGLGVLGFPEIEKNGIEISHLSFLLCSITAQPIGRWSYPVAFWSLITLEARKAILSLGGDTEMDTEKERERRKGRIEKGTEAGTEQKSGP